MKSAYEDVTRWVRFHASMTLHEMQFLNDGWLAPASAALMAGEKPSPDLLGPLLVRMEKTASVVWLLLREHEALLERVGELFGPKAAIELPHDVAERFAAAIGTERVPALVCRSIVSRIELLQAHAMAVDAHSRLIFKKHVCVLEGLILPFASSLCTSQSDAVLGEQAEWLESYRRFCPAGPRPHPDDFLREIERV
jgi:hypothetical protein